MTERMSIGRFAKLTHLSVKTLRHYHDMHVLAPAAVDPDTGYRFYEHSQAHRAHLVRRLREADMSLPEIAELLADTDEGARRSKVAAHADELARRAREMAAAAEALNEALADGVGALGIVRRDLAAKPALEIVGTVGLDAVATFCSNAFERLDQAAAGLGITVVGPGTASFGDDVFESEGVVTCWLEVDPSGLAPDASVLDASAADGDVSIGETPSGVYLVATHAGDRREVGVTYSALGRHVDELGVGAARPVLERYVVATGGVADLRTEVCWPVIN